MGDVDKATANQLIDNRNLDNLSMESIGWLLSALTGDSASAQTLDEMRRYLNNQITETAGAASFMVAQSRRYHVALIGSGPGPISQSLRRLVVVLVRAPEPAGRAGGSIHVPAVGGGLHLYVCRPGRHTGHGHCAAYEGRGDVLTGGLRQERDRAGGGVGRGLAIGE